MNKDKTTDLSMPSSLAQARFLLTGFFILTLPLLIYLPTTSYTYTKLAYSIFMISFLLILWLAEMILDQGYTLHLSTLFLPLLALLGVGAISMINSQNLATSLSSLTLILYFFIFYLSLINTIQNLREGIFLLGCLLTTGSLIAIYALLQYYGLLLGPPGTTGAEAMISTLGNKNYVAEFLSFLFVPSFLVLFKGKHLLSRLLTLILIGLMMAVLVHAGSRGAWLAVIFSSIFFGIGLISLHLTSVIRQNIKWLCSLLCLGLILLVILSGTQMPNFTFATNPLKLLLVSSNRVLNANNSSKSGSIIRADDNNISQRSSPNQQTEDRGRRSILQRILNWRIGWEMFKDHPILGVGLGNYKLKFLPYKAKLLKQEPTTNIFHAFYFPRSTQAHNEYVQIAAEMGGLGVLIVAWLLWAYFQRMLQVRTRPNKVKFPSLGLFGGWISFLIVGAISFPLHRPASALAGIVLSAILYSKGLSPHLKEDSDYLIKLTPKVITLVAAAVLLIVLATTATTYQDFRSNLYLESGRRDLEAGKIYHAKTKLTRSSQLAYNSSASYFYLGKVYGKLGKYKQAVDYLKRSLKGRVTEGSYLLLAQGYAELDKDDKAWEYLHRLLATEPHPAQKVKAYYLRAKLFRRKENIELALAQLEHVIEQANGLVKVKAYILKAEIYLDEGDKKSAKATYLQSLKVAKNELQEKKNRFKQRLTAQGLSFTQYNRLLAEIDNLETKIQQIQSALNELTSG